MAVGCIEPQFFAAMMERLPIDAGEYGHQLARAKWPEQHKMLEAVFMSKTRDEWEAIFALTDACVTPVLDYVEAATHPANADRQAVVTDGKWLHPQIAPRLSGHAQADSFLIATKGADYETVLAEAGIAGDAVAELVSAGAVITD